ncbi:MAG TPA: sugar transferase [Mycobacteriales bacterium]|nr:sugar transferase [Mycobacteriales bacterium]
MESALARFDTRELAALDRTFAPPLRSSWLSTYRRTLVILDATILVVAGVVGVVARFGVGAPGHEIHGVNYLAGSLLLVPVWIAVLALSRCYEERFLGNGTEEYRRVADASFRVTALIVFVLFMTQTEVSRGFLAVSLPFGLLGVVAGRYGARLVLQRRRMRGQCMHKVVVVGPAAQALEMTTHLQSQPLSGLQVVGACVAGDSRRYKDATMIPVLGALSDVIPVLERLGADSVVIAKGPGITAEDLRQLSYELEGTGVDLLVSPRLTNVMGSRISWRPIPGLPLMHVDEPELTGSRHLVKATFDRVVGLLLLLVASIVVLPLALAVRLTTKGPAFFRQERVGRSGETFSMWKLRTMHVNAEQRLDTLVAHNAHGAEGVLFKLREDPRVTPLGKFLRRFSIDELPQLLNVVRGDMSLVGPRPPLPSEVAKYEGHVHRRLLVKPGLTGLWQVSGRSDLAWEDAVRLDLHYVENWSLGLDVTIICKTVMAVLRQQGAY